MLPVYAAPAAEPVITTDPATGPIPQVTFQAADSFTQEDGSTYARVDPSHFPVYDEFDSTQVVDDGAPD